MKGVALALCITGWVASVNADTIIFSTNFDTTLPAAISPGTSTLTGVQLYAGLGPSGNQFGGNFFRGPTGNTVTLSLSGLPSHTAISLGFLFAAIDSLDGTGDFPQGDYFRVDLDGNQIFRESFANALDTQIQSYVPPAGGELARKVDLGFSGPGGWYRDSAYNMAIEPAFQNLAHSASTAVFTFVIEGVGIQSLEDESWAMDNLSVHVSGEPDADGDGVPDSSDNCILLANPDQCDSDGDGYGNRCDGDLNNNGATNAQDTAMFRIQLGQPSVGPTYNKADLNCNGAVNAQDTAMFRQLLGSPPGPSAFAP